ADFHFYISPSPGRSYATAVYDSIMAPTSSPAQSLVPSEAWAMLGRTDLEAYTSWDFPSQSAGHPDAGDASFNGVTPAGCAANLVRRRHPRLDYRRRVPRRHVHSCRVPPPRIARAAVRADRHDCPPSPPRSICVADVGASGSAFQLLPPGVQVSLHLAETGWGIE